MNLKSIVLFFDILVIFLFYSSCQKIEDGKINKVALTKVQTVSHFYAENGEESYFIEINAMEKTRNHYLFLDRKRQAAYITDKHFKSFKKITAFGEGPNEILSIGNFSNIHPGNQNFLIHDLKSRKYLLFSENHEFLKDFKQSYVRPWHNKFAYTDDFIFLAEGSSLNGNPEFVQVNLEGQLINKIKVNNNQQNFGESFDSFLLDNHFVFISTDNSPSYVIADKEGKIVNSGDFSSHPLFHDDVEIAKEIIEPYKNLDATIAVLQDIYIQGNSIYILGISYNKDGSSISNKVFELKFNKEMVLEIHSLYHLDKESDYRAIMLDGAMLIASNKRTGNLDIYTIPK
jgi:hypothetical protein